MNRLQRGMGATLLTFATAALISATALADPSSENLVSKKQSASNSNAAKQLSSWPAGPRLAGHEMIAKYGQPQEVTDHRMIWHDAGSFKRILLTREELPHHFPIVHMDYLEHTISYNVPHDKADELLAFDGAISIYRVGGELSARCDLESNNVLTLNLAHDIIEGKKNVEQARKEFGEAVMARTAAENPELTAALQFKRQAPEIAADTDSVTIPGAPQPADAKGKATDPDAETLALLIAADMDEVHAAMIASDKKIDEPILAFARMLHEAHGKHLKATAEVGMSNNITPIVTKKVSALQDKHADALAKIVPLDNDAFGPAYLEFMVKAHSDAQNMIDKRLAMTKNEEIKKHLTETRETITKHLQEAKSLQGEATRVTAL